MGNGFMAPSGIGQESCMFPMICYMMCGKFTKTASEGAIDLVGQFSTKQSRGMFEQLEAHCEYIVYRVTIFINGRISAPFV